MSYFFMMPKTIRICYRKLIDATTTGPWEALVFNDSYTEFLMQAQLYNQEKKYGTFAELITNVKGADQLHFLVSAAVIGYIKQLNGLIPDVKNALGISFLPFSNFRFEIINSSITDKGRHQVAINFYSDQVVWHDTVASMLILSLKHKPENGELLTELLSLTPFVSIYSIAETTSHEG